MSAFQQPHLLFGSSPQKANPNAQGFKILLNRPDAAAVRSLGRTISVPSLDRN